MTDPTPTRDEAVPERSRIEPLLKDGDVVDRLKQFRLRWQDSGDLTYLGKALVDAIVEIEATRKASAPAPASGRVDAVAEACAQAAEGPEYWPHPKQPGDVLTYRGTKDGNWLAVKPPFKLDPYSQGRADAAAAVRALSPAATPVSEAEPDGWQWRMWNGPAEQMSDWMEGRRQFSDAVAKSLRYEERPLYALAKPASSPAGVRRVRHKKRGCIYEVLGEAQVQTSRPLEDYEVVVIYRSLNTPDIDDPASPMKGDTWIRPKAEFNDGRFEELSQSTSAGRDLCIRETREPGA